MILENYYLKKPTTNKINKLNKNKNKNKNLIEYFLFIEYVLIILVNMCILYKEI